MPSAPHDLGRPITEFATTVGTDPVGLFDVGAGPEPLAAEQRRKELESLLNAGPVVTGQPACAWILEFVGQSRRPIARVARIRVLKIDVEYPRFQASELSPRPRTITYIITFELVTEVGWADVFSYRGRLEPWVVCRGEEEIFEARQEHVEKTHHVWDVAVYRSRDPHGNEEEFDRALREAIAKTLDEYALRALHHHVARAEDGDSKPAPIFRDRRRLPVEPTDPLPEVEFPDLPEDPPDAHPHLHPAHTEETEGDPVVAPPPNREPVKLPPRVGEPRPPSPGPKVYPGGAGSGGSRPPPRPPPRPSK